MRGKWYFEVTATSVGSGTWIGVTRNANFDTSTNNATDVAGVYHYRSNGNKGSGSSYTSSGYSSYGNGSVIGVAFDADEGKIYFYKDGSIQDSGTYAFDTVTNGPYFPMVAGYGGFNVTINFGASSFGQTVPSGYTAWGGGIPEKTTDTPTDNVCVLDQFQLRSGSGSLSLTDGNRLFGQVNSAYGRVTGTQVIDTSTSTGYYWEIHCQGKDQDGVGVGLFQANRNDSLNTSGSAQSNSVQMFARGSGGGNEYWFIDSLTSGGGTNYDTNIDHARYDKLQVYVKDRKMWVGRNNLIFNSGNTSTGANPIYSGLPDKMVPFFNAYQDNEYFVAFNSSDWTYTPPTGFKQISSDNQTESLKSSADWVWIKNRSSTDSHQVYDTNRGIKESLNPDHTDAAATVNDGLTKFLQGGFQVEDDVKVNTLREGYISWQWNCNSGTTTANTDGSGATVASTIQSNQTAGFSIVTWQKPNNSASSIKIQHGLNAVPEVFITRSRDNAGNWLMYHQALGNTKYLVLDNDSAEASNAGWTNNTSPTSTLFTQGSWYTDNAYTMVTYLFNSIPGYSKFGSFVGNGNVDGTFVYLGFKPKWVIFKCSSAGSLGWNIRDTSRSRFNPLTGDIQAQRNNAEVQSGSNIMDFVSNGIKCRGTGGAVNGSGATYIYMAFAEHPFIGDGTNPSTAR